MWSTVLRGCDESVGWSSVSRVRNGVAGQSIEPPSSASDGTTNRLQANKSTARRSPSRVVAQIHSAGVGTTSRNRGDDRVATQGTLVADNHGDDGETPGRRGEPKRLS